MPAFIFISGFFAKGIMRPGYLKKAAMKLLLPLAAFQIFYAVFYFWIEQEKALSVNLLVPEWSLWFLLSLFFWHVLLRIAVKWLKPVPALVISFAAGLLIGLVDEPLRVFSIGRTIVFFPFFLVGYYAKKEWFTPLFTVPARFILLTAAAVFFFFFYMHTHIQIEWLFGSHSYAALDAQPLSGISWRLFIYVLNLIMIAFIMSIVAHKRFFFTSWGQNTLYVYLLHGFFVQSSRRVDTLALPPSLLVLFLTAAGLTFLLASPFVAGLFQLFSTQKRLVVSTKKGD